MQMVRNTSIEAYSKIRNGGLLSHRRWQIYDWLFHHGPATANEIFNGIFGNEQPFTQSNIHARLFEMREMGCVVEVGRATDPTTKMNVLQWDVSDQMPVKVAKSRKKDAYDIGFEEALNAVLAETNRKLSEGKCGYAFKVDVTNIVSEVRGNNVD